MKYLILLLFCQGVFAMQDYATDVEGEEGIVFAAYETPDDIYTLMALPELYHKADSFVAYNLNNPEVKQYYTREEVKRVFDENFRFYPFKEMETLDLARVDFRHSRNYRDADFSGLDFNKHAKFVNADLQNADFCGANLQFVRFENCDLRGARFDGADLSYSEIKNSNLDGVFFYQAKLKEATLDDTTMNKTSFLETDLKDISASYIDFRTVQFGKGSTDPRILQEQDEAYLYECQ